MEYNSLHLETNAGNNKTLNIVYKHIHIGGRILLFFNKFEISLFHDINKALPKTIITVHKICVPIQDLQSKVKVKRKIAIDITKS